MAGFKIEVEGAALNIVEKLRDAQSGIIERVAAFTQRVMLDDMPENPEPGTFSFVSEKQRKYVMMLYSKGLIDIPYVRGRKRSERLNRSYLVIPETISSYALVSTASYADYVVGDKQAQGHKGRWKTGQEAAEQVLSSGEVEDMIEQTLNALFSGD